MTREVGNDILFRKINGFCNEKEDIKASRACISAWELINILKEYYQELYDLFDENSVFYQELLDEINSLISPDYISVLDKRGSSFSFSQLKLLVRDSLVKIIDNNYKLRGIKCDDIKIAICQNVSAIKLSIHENYELKPIIVCRDIEGGQLHLAKTSCNNEKLLEKMRSKIVNIFDTIDSYRATMPKVSMNDDIDEESFSDDVIINGNKYEVEFENELFKGKVEVQTNGKVNYSLAIYSDDQEFELSKTISVAEIMSKIPIDVASLKDPVRSIVLSSFEKEYMVINGEIKAM